MDECIQNRIPQGSNNLPVGSDRVQAPVANAGPKDFWGDQVHAVECKIATLRKKCEALCKEEDKFIQAIKDALSGMENYLAINKSTSTRIKTGVEKARLSLDALQKAREKNNTAREQLRKAEDEDVAKRHSIPQRQATEVQSTPRNVPTKKRPASSTPSPMSCTNKELTEEPSKESPGEWRERRLKRRRKSEAAPNSTAPKADNASWKQGIAEGRKKARKRPEAVLITLAGGMKYADVVKDIRMKVKPEEIGVEVRAVKETRAGNVLLELGSTSGNQSKFGEALQTAIGKTGDVRHLVPKGQVVIRDLDAATDEEEVKAALKVFSGAETGGYLKINMTKKTRWGTLTAFVETEEPFAAKLVEAEHIKIGWVSCSVRRHETVARCFRCHGFNHMAADCNSTDRGKICWRCGEGDHLSSNCKNKPKCYMCAEINTENTRVDHVAGSINCDVYKRAAKKRP